MDKQIGYILPLSNLLPEYVCIHIALKKLEKMKNICSFFLLCLLIFYLLFVLLNSFQRMKCVIISFQ